MKKQEIIHLHGLGKVLNNGLAGGLVGDYSEEFSKTPNSFSDREVPEYLQEYDDNGVYSTSIHKSKSDHEEAVFRLFSAIIDNLDQVESDDDGLDTIEQRVALVQDRREWRRQMYDIDRLQVEDSRMGNSDYTGEETGNSLSAD